MPAAAKPSEEKKVETPPIPAPAPAPAPAPTAEVKPVEAPKPVEEPKAEKVEEAPPTDIFTDFLNAELGVKVEDGKVVHLPRERFPKPAPKKPEPAPEEPKPEEAKVEPKEEPKPAPIEVSKQADEDARLEQRLAEVVDKAFDKRIPKPEPKPEKKEPEPDPDDEFIATLDEDSKYEVDLARFAEAKGQKGRVKETVTYLKAITDYFAKHKDEEGRTFDDEDEDYQKFLRQKRPKISPSERRRTEVAYAADIAGKEAEDRVRKELAPKIEAAEERTRDNEAKPRIAAELKKFNDDLLSIEAPADSPLKEAVDLVKAKGDAATDDDPVYGTIVLRELNFGRSAAAEFLALANGVKRFDPSGHLHKFLADFLENQGQDFAKNGGDMRARTLQDGTKQTFLTRLQYAQAIAKDPDKTSREHFTFSDQDVLDMISINTKKLITQNVELAATKLTKAGYGRLKPAPVQEPAPKPAENAPKPSPNGTPAPKPAPKPVNQDEEDESPPSPKLGSSTAPGAGRNGEIKSGERVFNDVDMEVLIPGYSKAR